LGQKRKATIFFKKLKNKNHWKLASVYSLELGLELGLRMLSRGVLPVCSVIGIRVRIRVKNASSGHDACLFSHWN